MRKHHILSHSNKLFALLLALILLLSSSDLSVFAAECTDQPEAISFSFLNTGSSANISATCYYSDEYFYQPGTIADSHLRTLSLAVAMSAFESFREDAEDYTDRCENFEKLMSEAGFFDFSHNEAFDEKPTEETIGIVIARRNIDVFGTEYNLIAVGIRGASYEAEWANNMRVGTSGQAEGFSSAKDQVLDYLSEYEARRGITDHAKIWITGFSRAGAVCNLTGQSLNEDPAAYATTTDDIYCYTFEAPQGEEISAAGQYRNIHNTVSPADPVALIPFSDWGMTRVGYTQEGQPSPYTQDDFLLPAPGSTEYEQQEPVMLAHLSEINPEIDYAIDDFTEFRFELFTDDSETLPLSQSDFIREFLPWLNSTLPERNRVSYAENYQAAFSKLARIITGAGVEKAHSIALAMEDAAKDPEFYAGLAAAVLVIRFQDTMDEEDYELRLTDCAAQISDCLADHLGENGVDLTDEERLDLTEALGPVIRFIDAALVDDVLHYGGYHMGTFFSNVALLVQAHNPEIILAWLQTYDSYYTPERFTPHQLEYHAEEEAACTKNGHLEYWECTECGILYSDETTAEKLDFKELILPATGHDWDNGRITKEATIYSSGLRTFTCRNCGKTHTETIARLPAPTKEPEVTKSTSESSASPWYSNLTAQPTPAAQTQAEEAKTADRNNGILPFALIVLAIIAALTAVYYFRKKSKH